MADDIHKFLDLFLAEQGLSRTDELVRFVHYDEENIGFSKNSEDVFSGEKCAGFKILGWFKEQGVAPLEPGAILVFTDAYGEIRFVSRITSFEIVAYKAITEVMTQAFAHGDGTIAKWRELSRAHLVKDCYEQNTVFDENTEIVITWYEKIYPN